MKEEKKNKRYVFSFLDEVFFLNEKKSFGCGGFCTVKSFCFSFL